MNMRKCISRALAGAAPALLASVFLATPAIGAGFVANLVTPPVTMDGGNKIGTANDSIALPQQGGTPQIGSLTICVGGANDGFLPCGSDADCTPTCKAGSCINNFLTNSGGPCTTNADCQGSPGACKVASASDGLTSGDTPANNWQGLNDAINGLKSTCTVNGTATSAAVTFVTNTVGTPLGISVCSTDADCGGATGSCATVGSAKKCVGHCQGGHICNNTGPKATNTCLAGSQKGTGCLADFSCPCTKDSDCGKDSNGFKGTCLDGLEYIFEVDGIIGSNPDNSPSCLGQDCRVGSGGACVNKKCVGGPNVGAACDPKAADHGFSSCNVANANCLAGRCSNGESICQTDSQCQGAGTSCTTNADCGSSTCTLGNACTSIADCVGPGVSCLGSGFCGPGVCKGTACLLPPVTMTGDETGFNFGPVKAFLLCPLAFRLDFPMQAKNGKGQVKTDVAKTSLGVFIPPGTNSTVTKCALHEAGSSDVTELGFFAGTSAEIIEGAVEPPAPGLLLPLGGPTLGQAINSGHGPVIGISGGQVK